MLSGCQGRTAGAVRGLRGGGGRWAAAPPARNGLYGKQPGRRVQGAGRGGRGHRLNRAAGSPGQGKGHWGETSAPSGRAAGAVPRSEPPRGRSGSSSRCNAPRGRRQPRQGHLPSLQVSWAAVSACPPPAPAPARPANPLPARPEPPYPLSPGCREGRAGGKAQPPPRRGPGHAALPDPADLPTYLPACLPAGGGAGEALRGAALPPPALADSALRGGGGGGGAAPVPPPPSRQRQRGTAAIGRCPAARGGGAAAPHWLAAPPPRPARWGRAGPRRSGGGGGGCRFCGGGGGRGTEAGVKQAFVSLSPELTRLNTFNVFKYGWKSTRFLCRRGSRRLPKRENKCKRVD